MNHTQILNGIEQTDYWDAQILDFEIKYLGDEVNLFIESHALEDVEKFCWRIKFLRCAKVNYETDANWLTESQGKKTLWREKDVKTLRGGQLLGYSGYDIQVLNMGDEFYSSKIILANMSINIVCQDIEVSKVLIADQHFFWDEDN
ncbi:MULTISPECIES: hypothetical protein [unclassified Streptococcus]|uniref:hypothetical protein n=1 Tax=unclassified Streptococcus TaxID=2608887 RepID=UPI001071825F|nr:MULTISPECIES: hypothetical protein [unclassified Streptococcus]MBF0786853.1 hypothetical protein [Streptococcus sp. 19428wC2_LYSM12]MCQ9212736.1 hypothetical protein [Streptococcus sp. B01]MCQ9214077.1 hypothetical protein [Streptococcus sp. O1]TFV06223.1 hypothetical protein E4T79_02855 [Streptococcus sp. LYSM12]